MGFQELLLVVLTSVLFSLLILNINQTSLRNQEALQETEIVHTAISVAQRFIEEAKSKEYDAVSASLDPGDMPDGFTTVYGLGHNNSEHYPNFSDVDDYHGFNQTVTVRGMDFQVQISVVYVRDTNPEASYSNETFFKKMTVNVNSSYLSHGITLKQVISY